jgi:ABC-type transporter Mla subunit MlaD
MRTPSRFAAFHRSSLVFTLSGAVLLGGILALYGRQYGWFERSLRIHLEVPNSQGLHIGTPVQLSGLRIGVLDQLTLLPDGKVRLELRVPDRYRPWLSPRSTATIGRDGLLGDSVVELTAAPMPAASVPRSLSLSTQVTPGLDSLLTGLEATRADLQKLLISSTRVTDRDIPASLSQLRTSLASGTAASATINRELPPTAAQLRETLSTANRTAQSAQRTSEQVQLALREMRPDLRQALAEFSSAIHHTNDLLEQFNGFLQPAGRSAEPVRAPAGANAAAPAMAPKPGQRPSTPP